MRTVAVTGAKGVIGKVISGGLAGWEIRGLDLPECDARDYAQVLTALRGAHAVVHLAWDGRENYLLGSLEPDNHLMAHNVYAAARAAGVSRVVAASSVHADGFWPRREAPLRIEDAPIPTARTAPTTLAGIRGKMSGCRCEGVGSALARRPAPPPATSRRRACARLPRRSSSAERAERGAHENPAHKLARRELLSGQAP